MPEIQSYFRLQRVATMINEVILDSMSELFEAAAKLRREIDLSEKSRTAEHRKFEQARWQEFQILTPVVVRTLKDIGDALYGRGFLLRKYHVATIGYGQEANDSNVGWHLMRYRGSNPSRAKISIRIEGRGFSIMRDGNVCNVKYTSSLSDSELVDALKEILPSLL
jgi:hypothetical protein